MVNKFQELQCHFLANAIIAGFMVQAFLFWGCGTFVLSRALAHIHTQRHAHRGEKYVAGGGLN